MSTPLHIAIAVGHTPSDPGACSPHLDVCEWTFNAEVARHLMCRLSARGHEARIFYRPDDGRSTRARIKSMCEQINAWGAGACVSLHFNSFGDPEAHGTQMHYWPTSRSGRRLALHLQQHTVALLRTRDRGLRASDGLHVLRYTACPAVLCEPFFGSNKADCDEANRVGRAALAHAYADALQWWAGDRAR